MFTMLPLWIAAGISIILMFLQVVRKISLSNPALVYTGIVLFPVWCVYALFHVIRRMGAVSDTFETVPGNSLLSIFGKVSGATVLELLLAMFLISIPFLLFLTGYMKINIFPYKLVFKCTPEDRIANARIACLRLCRYALFMLVVYLSISAYTLIVSFEPVLLGLSMLSMSLPWGIAGTLILIVLMPPLGLLACLVVAGLSASILFVSLLPVMFVALLLTLSWVITLNAIIRTCRFTGTKTLGLAFLSILPVVNVGILVYLLAQRLHKKLGVMV